MGRKTKYSKETKLAVVRRYIAGESATMLAHEFSIRGKYPDNMIRKWRRKFDVLGISAFTDMSYKYFLVLILRIQLLILVFYRSLEDNDLKT